MYTVNTPITQFFHLVTCSNSHLFSVHLFLQSSVCEKIMELLGQNKIDHHQRQVAILSQDSFYKVLTPEQKAKALKGQFNFDHPGMKHWIAGGTAQALCQG